jgi:hypothetical protein
MNYCDCIKKLDLSNGVTSTEIDKHPCLRDIKDLPDDLTKNIIENINKGIIPTPPVPVTKSVAILYKAIQELKAEIDTLKSEINLLKSK